LVESKEKYDEKALITKPELPEKFLYKKEKVALVKLDDYEPENVKRALQSLIRLLDINDFFKRKSILLKPNVLASSKGAFTPAVFMEELIGIINEQKTVKEIFVGDSTITKKYTSVALKSSKIKEKTEAKGAKILNFFESERIKIDLKKPIYHIEESIYLPKEVCEVDLVVNLPKLKTHGGYVYTGAIKNLFGLLGNKQKMHMTHKIKSNFQKMLADIYFAVEETNNTNYPKVLTIMDAVIAMEGKGPRGGDPRKVGLLIAGFNSAAVDIVGYTLMNGNPKDLEAINSVAKRTELPVDISQIDIIGDVDYKDHVIKDFKKPKVKMLKKGTVPEEGFSSKIRNKAMSISIKINKSKCILCESCVKHCPAKAMERKNEKIVIDTNKCIECFCCGESCPNGAISAKWFIFRIAPYLGLLLFVSVTMLIWLLILIIMKLLGL
jgi:uncharacterized protein (DUF362 family)/NAD-dependent dihydropyrimidine dehydrogenase PreA subunit